MRKSSIISECRKFFDETDFYQTKYFRDVAQLVARVVWDHDVAGSNPVIPTKKRQTDLFRLSFF